VFAIPCCETAYPNPNPCLSALALALALALTLTLTLTPRTALRVGQDVPEDGEPVALAFVHPAAQQRRGASLDPHTAAARARDVAVGQQGVGALRQANIARCLQAALGETCAAAFLPSSGKVAIDSDEGMRQLRSP